MNFDASSRRLFIAHLGKITVFEPDTNVIVGSVGPIEESHGVAVVAAMHKAYDSDGKAGVLKVINLATPQPHPVSARNPTSMVKPCPTRFFAI